MKKLRLTFFFFSMCFTLAASTKKDEPEWLEKKVVIAGKVLNFGNHQDHKTMQFIFQDLFDGQKNYTATINPDGTFKTAFLLPYAQEFYLEYGDLTTLYCSPGDSLFLEVDADIWLNGENTKPNGKFYIQATGGNAIKLNQSILKFLDELPGEQYWGSNANNAVKSKSPAEYHAYITAREKVYRNFLKKFNKANKTEQAFKSWADRRLKYESWNDLMRYRWFHPLLNKIKTDSLKLPNDYYSFLKKYDMNDRNVNTISHADFLYELIHYSQAKKANPAEKLVESIRQNTAGFTQQVVFTYFFVKMLKAQHLSFFEEEYTPDLITEPYLRRKINSEHENLKAFLANTNTKGANLLDIESSITADLVQTILKRFKGKVIYIDFWGPWCAPYMQEMPASKDMQQYFKDKEVVFLFLANRTKDDSWKATIANKELTGEHLNLTDDQFNILSSAFGIAGVPHYTLIDKKGDVILKKAPRPSEKETLKKEIEKLLK